MSAFSRRRPDCRLIAMMAALVVAAGCATQKSAQLPEMTNWERRTAVLAGLEKWEFGGRIGVRANDDGFNGKLRYVQDKDGFHATVSGPLGIGTVRLEGNGRSVVLTDKEGVRTELADAERELRLRYGWTIPVASLRYWALGIPDPGAPAETRFGEDGRLENLTQMAWTVDISRYRDGGGQFMPGRLTAENGDTRVRLVIDHWIFFD